jgi:glycosyltransferase involved in cell wall biosynthesis
MAPSRPSVLIVGQGPPVTGGIPSFISALQEDDLVRERVRLESLNTTPPGPKRPGAATAANLTQALRDAARVMARARRVDVVHLNLAAAPSLPLLRALLLAAAARAGGARVILHAHTGRLDRSARSPVYRSLLRLVGRLVDRLVVVSLAAEHTARRLAPRVIRIPNGVDPSQFATGPKDEAPPTVAFLGTVSERKGLLDLRDALLELRHDAARPRAVVIGDARQEGPGVFERVQDAYRAVDLVDVEFTGALPHEQIVSRLAGVAIFCLPSYWEGFPLALLEAMASGCAVIASRVGDIPVMVDGGRGGILVDPGDVPGLASALRRLVGDPSERQRLGREARRLVEERYSLNRVAEAMVPLYEELAGYSM